MVQSYVNQSGTPDATGDDAIGSAGSFAATSTAMAHLGGAMAPALVNMVSLASHSIPYLSTTNKKTGYGGGHGMAASVNAIFRAGSNLSLLKGGLFVDPTGSARELQKIIDGGESSLKRFGLSLDEAEFLRDLTAQGVLTPNLFNALTNTAKTGKSNNAIAKFAQSWMKGFAKTEQYNRRVTALASYRLDKARMEQTKEGVDQKELIRRAIRAVDFSQGNYDSFNRPSWAQGNVLQYLWMYKQFVLITIQLMRNLAPKEKMIFLSFLVITSGLKGIPFSDDFADLVDTLMQKFNIKWKGLEAEIALISEDLGIPSILVLRGVIDYATGVTVSSRIGQTDLIPGTGYFKAGGDFGRELKSIFGPVYSAWEGFATSAGLVGSYTAEALGLKEDVTTLKQIARGGFGFSAIKGYAQGAIYFSDGAVTNERGQVIASDLGIKDVIYRMMGFQPGAATRQRDVVRITNNLRDYAMALTTEYKYAYIRGNAKERRQVLRDVRAWNKDAKGTPFFIKNFPLKATKALRDAKRTVSARNLRSTPTAIKPIGVDIIRAFGLDKRGIPTGEVIQQ